MQRFDHFEALAQNFSSTANGNGAVKPEPIKQESTPPSSIRSPKSEPQSDSEDAPPPKKKRKQVATGETDDAKLAAMLQAQENRGVRATRGGASNKKVVKKVKKPRKKSEKKIAKDEDSDVEVGSDGEVKEKPKKGGFHKQYNLSAPLADLVGETTVRLLSTCCSGLFSDGHVDEWGRVLMDSSSRDHK